MNKNTQNQDSVSHRDESQSPCQSQKTGRRLFPNMTVWELSAALNNAGAEQADTIRLAIRQRDPLSPDFVKPFKVPQLDGKFTLKANP